MKLLLGWSNPLPLLKSIPHSVFLRIAAPRIGTVSLLTELRCLPYQRGHLFFSEDKEIAECATSNTLELDGSRKLDLMLAPEITPFAIVIFFSL